MEWVNDQRFCERWAGSVGFEARCCPILASRILSYSSQSISAVCIHSLMVFSFANPS